MKIALLSKNIGKLVQRAQTPPPDVAEEGAPEEAPAEAPAETDTGGAPSLEQVEEEQLDLPLKEQKTLPMPQIQRIRNWNMTEVSIGDLDMYFSYQTMVAFNTPSSGKVVQKNEWGATTGKHLNYVDGGAINNRVDAEEFARRWNEVATKYLTAP